MLQNCQPATLGVDHREALALRQVQGAVGARVHARAGDLQLGGGEAHVEIGPRRGLRLFGAPLPLLFRDNARISRQRYQIQVLGLSLHGEESIADLNHVTLG
ncbi:hypothetical protein F9K50_10830, partial [bacterium]